MNTPNNGFVNFAIKSWNAGISANGLTASFIIIIPFINTANPTNSVRILFFWTFFKNIIIMIPISAKIGAEFSGFNICIQILLPLISVIDKIHAVKVVPTFAPKITQTVCENFMIPEFTSPTSITVVAEDDCIAIVIKAPSTKLKNGIDVIFWNRGSRLPHAIITKLDDITLIDRKTVG